MAYTLDIKHTVKTFVQGVVYTPQAKMVLQKIPVVRDFYPPFERRHPFDVEYGIETSGRVPLAKLHWDRALLTKVNPYAGSQPSIIRKVLAALGDVSEYTFADIGCGKGRAAIVASEFQFKEVVGVELSAELSEIARANARKIAARFQWRPSIKIVATNALELPLPKGYLVLFLYNPFQEELMSQMVKMTCPQFPSGVKTECTTDSICRFAFI